MLREYTPSEAVYELKRRQKDATLIERVEEYIGIMPNGIPTEPFAALCRQVATGRGEDAAFCRMADSLGLVPFWPSYISDKFTTQNRDKVNLCKLSIMSPRQKPEGYENRKVVKRMDHFEGMALSGVMTNCQLDGTQLSLPELHHYLRTFALGIAAKNTTDFSKWLGQIIAREGGQRDGSNTAQIYYPYYLALFIVHGILIEDYTGGPNSSGSLANFVMRIVEPAFEQIKKAIGYEPIYVRLPWEDGFGLYPNAVIQELDSMII